jgi:hypothetical protein
MKRARSNATSPGNPLLRPARRAGATISLRHASGDRSEGSVGVDCCPTNGRRPPRRDRAKRNSAPSDDASAFASLALASPWTMASSTMAGEAQPWSTPCTSRWAIAAISRLNACMRVRRASTSAAVGAGLVSIIMPSPSSMAGSPRSIAESQGRLPAGPPSPTMAQFQRCGCSILIVILCPPFLAAQAVHRRVAGGGLPSACSDSRDFRQSFRIIDSVEFSSTT